MIGSSIVSSPQEGLDKLARHARGVLVLIAGLQAGLAALLYVAGGPPEEALIMPTLVTAIIYGALATWARTAPMPAVLVGFVLYLVSVAVGLAQGDSLLSYGSLFKGMILVLFINGLGSARSYDQAKRALARQRAKGG